MRCTLVLLVALPVAGLAAEPEPLVHLGSDRFRQADWVRAIVYSPDGRRMATADGPSINIWDAADGRLLRTIPGPEKQTVDVLCFRPDGRSLNVAGRTDWYAVGQTDRNVITFRHLDSVDGKEVASSVVVQGDEGPSHRTEARFSPDGAYLAVRSDNGTRLRLFDTAARKEVWVQRRDGDAQVWSHRFRPDGRALAVGSEAGRVEVLEAATGKVVHACKVQGRVVENLAFSPDGKNLVAIAFDPSPSRMIRFEAETGKVRWMTEVESAVLLAFTADGKAVRYWGQGKNRSDPSVWRWLDAATGKLQSTLDTGAGKEEAIRPDEKTMALGGFEGHISQWDLTTQKRLDDRSADPGLPVTELSFTLDGTRVRGWANGWYEWEVKTGKQTRLSPPLAIGASETAVASPDSRWLVSGSDTLVFAEVGRDRNRLALGTKGDVFRFLRTGHMIRRRDHSCLTIFDPSDGKAWNPGFWEPVLQIEAKEGGLAASADGTTAIRVSPSGDHFRGTRWDIITGKPIGEWDGRLHDPSLMERSHDWRAALSPDGRVLAVFFTHLAHPGMGFNRIEELHTALFDARTGRYLSGWWDLHFQAELAFSRDGRTVVCYYPSGLGVDIREVATGDRRTRRACPPIHSAAFSPDGRLLALATGPTPVALWDLVGKPAGPWADQKPANLWDGLAGENAELAFDVIRTLRQHPAEAVAFLKERVKVPTAPAAEWVAGRIKALDAAGFRDREQATADLASVGELVVPELRAALKSASPEARRRLEGLLEKATTPSRETWRVIRACEALEGIGTPAARGLLAAWAKGSPGATLTREAAESMERLIRRDK